MCLRAMWKVLLLLFVSSFGNLVIARHEEEPVSRLIAAPNWKPWGTVIDGSGKEYTLDTSGVDMGRDIGGTNRVPVLTVAFCTLAMAAATGFGAVPFFFVELDPQWAGICNGIAAGVMLAASFDLIREGQDHGSGSWVVSGILAGSIFIMFCKKFLEKYGEVSMLDIKGAEAAKAILVVGIMTLHSVGEGSGVGVSFAGSKGLSQGILIALAIAVHNIPEGLAVSMVLSSRGVSPKNAMLWSVITSLPQPIVAVPSFICAEAFSKLLPFATGFAAGCMIWMVMSEVLPDSFKEASPSHVASAATLSVAFMEALSTAFEHFGHSYNLEDASGFAVSLLFGLGPLLGGLALAAFALSFKTHPSLLTGVASGIAAVLSLWRPLQLFLSSKMGFFPVLLIGIGSASAHAALSCATKFRNEQKTSADIIKGSPFSPMTLIHAILLSAAISFHALAEGLALGVAAPRAYGLGRHIILPVSLHGFPRGAAAASCVLGATNNWYLSSLSAAVVGVAGPLGAIGAILGGIGYSGLDHVMMLACGALVPCFGSIIQRGVKLDKRRSIGGFLVGAACAATCLMCTKLVCLHTPYCNSAPEAVR